MRNLIYLALLGIFTLFTSCRSDDTISPSPPCDLINENAAFAQIDSTVAIQDLEGIIGVDFTQALYEGSMTTLTWIFCDNPNLFISLVYIDNKIVSKTKSFSNSSCSDEINQDNFELIMDDNSYQQVRVILNNVGDKYFVEYTYAPTFALSETVVWYDCTDVSKRIQVVLLNDEVIEKSTNL